MSKRRSFVMGMGLALAAPLVASACHPIQEPDPEVTSSATTWLTGRQQADGGFELAGFPGFETPDAIFALAGTAQRGPAWDPVAARTLVASLHRAGPATPLDYVDDLVDGAPAPTTVASAAKAAKIVSLVAAPLGLSATDFDPSNDSASAVNLVTRINTFARPDGSLAYGAQFNGVLYAAIALQETGQTVPAGLITQIRSAQRTDGSFNFAGSQDPSVDGDVDTTALALTALRTNQLGVANPTVLAAVRYLAASQSASGAWSNFGDNPNSTAVAAIALTDLHIDVTTPAWRSTYGNPVPNGATYTSPYKYLNEQKADDGHIASANDGYGLNTFGTSQAIQALTRQWYVAGEHLAVSTAISSRIGSPLLAPANSLAPVASASIGSNVSIDAARQRGATAVLTSQPGREAAVEDLYRQALGRSAEPNARAWTASSLSDVDRPTVLVGLVTTDEFVNAHGPGAGPYVDGLYQVILGRPADAGGRAYWVDRLNQGMSRGDVARAFVDSAEARHFTTAAAYQRVLHRPATSSELSFGTAYLANNRIEVLLAALAGSPEFYAQVTAANG